MKEIKIKSKKRVIELLIKDSIFIRLAKLILNPEKLLKKLINYKYNLSKTKKIDWTDRAKKLGK